MGVSATHLDWTMVPYVRKSFMKHYIMAYLKTKDDFYEMDLLSMSNEELDEWIDTNKKKYLSELNLTEEDFYFDNKKNLNKYFYQSALFDTKRETYQASEAMYHNLNSLQSRSGCQLPFTSCNWGTCTIPEARMVSHALLDALYNGVGKLHRTSIFPCCIFQYMKGVNDKPGTPNYDLYRKALKCTAKRLYPNYANVDWSGNAGYDRNDPRTYFSTINKTVA
jgi:ribonucleoside-triphosphate reductase